MNRPQECLNFTRSSSSFPTLDCSLTDYSEQLNLVTAYIDGSQIYGSSADKSAELRLGSGGLLKTSPSVAFPPKSYLPLTYGPNGNQSDECSLTEQISCFIAGDTRTNNNLGLAGVHTLFLREHNRIATKLASVNTWMNDEQLFNEARRILIAIYQHIVYNEWVGKKCLFY